MAITIVRVSACRITFSIANTTVKPMTGLATLDLLETLRLHIVELQRQCDEWESRWRKEVNERLEWEGRYQELIKRDGENRC